MQEKLKAIFKDRHNPTAWILMIIMSVVWVALIMGKSWIAFSVFSFFYYLMIAYFLGRVEFSSEGIFRIVPLHFIPSKRKKRISFTDVDTGTYLYFDAPKNHYHQLQLELNTKGRFLQIIEEEGEAMVVMTILIEQGVRLRINNNTELLKKVNRTLRHLYPNQVKDANKYGISAFLYN